MSIAATDISQSELAQPAVIVPAAAQFGMGRVAKEDSSPWSAGTGLRGLRQPRLADSTRAGKLADFGSSAAQMYFVI